MILIFFYVWIQRPHQVRSHSLLKLRTPSPSMLAQVTKKTKSKKKIAIQSGQSPIKLKTGSGLGGKHLWIRYIFSKQWKTFVKKLFIPGEGWSHPQVGPLQIFHIQVVIFHNNPLQRLERVSSLPIGEFFSPSFQQKLAENFRALSEKVSINVVKMIISVLFYAS